MQANQALHHYLVSAARTRRVSVTFGSEKKEEA